MAKAKKTTKTFEVYDGSNWVEMEKGKEFFGACEQAGLPIRIVHPNGSIKVIRNAENAPEDQRESVVTWLGARKDKELGAYFGAIVASS